MYAKLINKFNQLDENNLKHIPESYQEVIKENLWITESDSRQGTAFLLKDIGFVTCYHCVYNNDDVQTENLKLFQNAAKNYEIEILKCDKYTDIAILKLKDIDIDIKKEGFFYWRLFKFNLWFKINSCGIPRTRMRV